MITYKELFSQYFKLQNNIGIISTLKDRLQLAYDYYGKCALITLKERNILARYLNLFGQSTQVESLLNDVDILNTHQHNIEVFMQVLYSIDHLSTAYEKQEKMIEATNLLETSLNLRQMKLVNRNDLDTTPQGYSKDLLLSIIDAEHQESNVATNLLETSLNEQQMKMANSNDHETYAIRIRLNQMYTKMGNDSRALYHLNIAKEIKNITSNTVNNAEIDVLIAAQLKRLKDNKERYKNEMVGVSSVSTGKCSLNDDNCVDHE